MNIAQLQECIIVYIMSFKWTNAGLFKLFEVNCNNSIYTLMRKYIVAQFYPIPTLFLFQLPDLEKCRLAFHPIITFRENAS